MTPEEKAAKDWLDELALDGERIAKSAKVSAGNAWMDPRDAERWRTKSEQALVGLLGERHTIVVRWQAHSDGRHANYASVCRSQVGILEAVADLLANGQLRGLYQQVRVSTVLDVLKDAEHLLSKGYLAAAMVLGGGALEAHLREMCASRPAITIQGYGMTSKYVEALYAEKVVDGPTHKLLTAWGGARNDAAHDPASYAPLAKVVELHLAGIRHFITTQS